MIHPQLDGPSVKHHTQKGPATSLCTYQVWRSIWHSRSPCPRYGRPGKHTGPRDPPWCTTEDPVQPTEDTTRPPEVITDRIPPESPKRPSLFRASEGAYRVGKRGPSPESEIPCLKVREDWGRKGSREVVTYRLRVSLSPRISISPKGEGISSTQWTFDGLLDTDPIS